MTEAKRYNVYDRHLSQGGGHDFEEDSEGDYVTYTDYANRIEELEAKLAKVVELLEAWINVATHCTIEDGVCCCGDNMDTHASPMDCGHSPVDHGAYVAMGLADETNTTLAELKKGELND